MLTITVLLLVLYTAWVMTSIGAIGHAQVLSAIPNASAILSDFPNPGAVFTGLLALTNGGYIAGKWQFGTHETGRGNSDVQ